MKRSCGVAFAPNAGSRISELRETSGDNAATSIGLLRDAVDPAEPPSARDYIAAYTHPLPAGTFNRPYRCVVTVAATTCGYDAPDLPPGGGHFERTLSIAPGSDELVVSLRFAPVDAGSTVRLESVSGFAFRPGDVLIAPAGAPYLGILHGRSLASLRWHAGEVANVSLRQTRGAQLVTLLFFGRTAQVRLRIDDVAGAPEAERLLQANSP